jgi:PPK2 family polyphosphate:nucleotide phosphotransferase
VRDELRIEPGTSPDLASRETRSRFGLDGKSEGRRRLRELQERLRTLQAHLYAEREQALLLVLQGMDGSGKDSTIRRVFEGVNPQGVWVRSFGRPEEAELARDYLWRAHRDVPRRGKIGIFNRSHYEDVGVVRVDELVPPAVWRRRYRHIREFERLLTDEGTTIVKVWLHISPEEQQTRLQRRIDDPDRNWKFEPQDLEARRKWPLYLAAYEEAIAETSTADAPWYVVPAERRWARDVAIASLLVETLEEMEPQLPPPDPRLEGVTIP